MSNSKIIYDIGRTKLGQPVRLEVHDDGSFSLIRDAANQRDDAAFIHGLTRMQIEKIGRAAHIEIGAL